MSDQPSVRVMTWNIHGALGRNPTFDLRRVVKLIKDHNPDIIALQEVDSRRSKAQGENPFVVLQHELGHHGADARSIVTADGDYGQVLLSRWPMEQWSIHDLSYPEREPRRAMEAEIKTKVGTLRVVATHLGLSLKERVSQSRKLLDIIGPRTHTTIVLGDFNDWLWAGSVRSILKQACPGRTRFRTFPSLFPLLRLDRIYCHPANALLRSFTEPSARHISDHLPVFADIRPARQIFEAKGEEACSLPAIAAP